jgi:hypothetical protein
MKSVSLSGPPKAMLVHLAGARLDVVQRNADATEYPDCPKCRMGNDNITIVVERDAVRSSTGELYE